MRVSRWQHLHLMAVHQLLLDDPHAHGTVARTILSSPNYRVQWPCRESAFHAWYATRGRVPRSSPILKEVWVEGSYAFRNPNEDMPGDWDDEPRRMLHYQALDKPLDAQTFVRALKARLTTALAQFN